VGRNGSRRVLTISLSATVPEKSRGYKKCDEEEEKEEAENDKNWPFEHRCKTAVTWLYAATY